MMHRRGIVNSLRARGDGVYRICKIKILTKVAAESIGPRELASRERCATEQRFARPSVELYLESLVLSVVDATSMSERTLRTPAVMMRVSRPFHSDETMQEK